MQTNTLERGATRRRASKPTPALPVARTPAEWLASPAFAHVTVVNPLGWSDDEADAAMSRPIGYDEFRLRLAQSVVAVPTGTTIP